MIAQPGLIEEALMKTNVAEAHRAAAARAAAASGRKRGRMFGLDRRTQPPVPPVAPTGDRLRAAESRLRNVEDRLRRATRELEEERRLRAETLATLEELQGRHGRLRALYEEVLDASAALVAFVAPTPWMRAARGAQTLREHLAAPLEERP